MAEGEELDYSVFWGHFHGDPVTVTNPVGIGYNRLHVDLDLGAEVPGPNPDVDVEFDIVFGCTDGTVELAIEELEIETDSVLADLFVPDDFTLDDQTISTGSTLCPAIDIRGSVDEPFVTILPTFEPPTPDPDDSPQDEAPDDGVFG